MKTNLSLCAENFGVPLRLIVRFDQQVIYDQLIQEATVISHSFDDDHITHTLELELVGKLPEHTVLDNFGKIVYDSLIEISNVTLAGIDLGPIFLTSCEYTHDFNGTKSEGVHDFYGLMGCNGIVKFEFDGPVYRWLLESL